MKATAENIRDVVLFEQSSAGPAYRCTLDLTIISTDPISGNEFVHPDSGTVTYCARPDDPYGLGPTVYAMIQNGQFGGEITDATGESG